LYAILIKEKEIDKLGFIGGEHDVGIAESEIFRTKGTSSGFGMV
jgi:hypothetical protein